MKIIKEEEQIQRSFIYWLRKTHNIPTGMSPIVKLSVQHGARMKAMGYSRGWPDIFIPRARKGFNGLFIEFKGSKGRIDNEYQVPMIAHLQDEGYKVVVCRSVDEAIMVTENYLK